MGSARLAGELQAHLLSSCFSVLRIQPPRHLCLHRMQVLQGAYLLSGHLEGLEGERELVPPFLETLNLRITAHWLELSHMAKPTCKEAGKCSLVGGNLIKLALSLEILAPWSNSAT